MKLSRRGLLGAAAAVPVVSAAGLGRAGQGAAPSAFRLMAAEARYLPRWIELLDEPGERARLERQGVDGEWIPRMLRNGVTQYASFLGAEAIALRDITRQTTAPLDPDSLVAVDAVEAIAEASAGRRVVMLNEAHNASRHRALLASLLPRLRREGFTHLAAETFSETVGSLTRGDAVTPAHGYYVRDPVYAEAVRQALELGYRLVAYEQRDDQRIAGSQLNDAATLVREQAQADNLAAVLAREPEARVLVFVGYGHLREAADQPFFGARLKRDTGIDPLTVGQAGVGAFGPHIEDAPPVRALLERFRPERPVVLSLKGQRAASATTDTELTSEGTDLIVLHPALPDVDGRPGWLAGDPGRRRIEVSVPAGSGPRLVQAIHAADADPAIPADQFLVEDDGGQAVLWLRPGRYRLRLETAAGFTALGEVEAT
ncbi:hypothetical protein [Brevundimonas sp. LjRoot202]|uniref:hypothetical protein n=1 Tax=Brevundimonas sp. LjRoot202 TaxID=3342281 RepID=UPI003ED0BA4F